MGTPRCLERLGGSWTRTSQQRRGGRRERFQHRGSSCRAGICTAGVVAAGGRPAVCTDRRSGIRRGSDALSTSRWFPASSPPPPSCQPRWPSSRVPSASITRPPVLRYVPRPTLRAIGLCTRLQRTCPQVCGGRRQGIAKPCSVFLCKSGPGQEAYSSLVNCSTGRLWRIQARGPRIIPVDVGLCASSRFVAAVRAEFSLRPGTLHRNTAPPGCSAGAYLYSKRCSSRGLENTDQARASTPSWHATART